MFFSNDILSNLLSSSFKIQIRKLYYNIIQKGFSIKKIKINGDFYYNCVYGNLNILEKSYKKMYIYENKSFSQYGKVKYNYITHNKKIKKYINVCINIDNINKDNLNIVYVNILSFSYIRSIQEESLDKNSLYIFSMQKSYELLVLADFLLLVESKYNKDISELVDYFLEKGKEILVLPGDVWDKNCYFSNFLIKEGANVITSINDINLYL